MKAFFAFFTTPIPNPFAYWFQKEFAPIMPRKWKRMLYVSSVISMTSFADRPDFQLFQRINEILRMTYRPADYWIPKFIRNMIWKSIVRQKSLVVGDQPLEVFKLDSRAFTEEELDQICHFLSDNAPEWIIYAPESVLKSDARKCLSLLLTARYQPEALSAV